MTEFDKGWLVAMLEADAGIYSELDRHGKRRAVIDIEAANATVVHKLAGMIGARTPTVRKQKPNQAGAWRQDTHRARLRGPAAAELLLSLFDQFTPHTQARIAAAVSK
jgi:hypothetical protein